MVGQYYHYVQSFKLQNKRSAAFSINSNNDVGKRQLVSKRSSYASRGKLKEYH